MADPGVCSKCRCKHPIVPGATFIACAHVHDGKPCEDQHEETPSHTRNRIEELSHTWGMTVEDWQLSNLDHLALDGDEVGGEG